MSSQAVCHSFAPYADSEAASFAARPYLSISHIDSCCDPMKEDVTFATRAAEPRKWYPCPSMPLLYSEPVGYMCVEVELFSMDDRPWSVVIVFTSHS